MESVFIDRYFVSGSGISSGNRSGKGSAIAKWFKDPAQININFLLCLVLLMRYGDVLICEREDPPSKPNMLNHLETFYFISY